MKVRSSDLRGSRLISWKRSTFSGSVALAVLIRGLEALLLLEFDSSAVTDQCHNQHNQVPSSCEIQLVPVFGPRIHPCHPATLLQGESECIGDHRLWNVHSSRRR